MRWLERVYSWLVSETPTSETPREIETSPAIPPAGDSAGKVIRELGPAAILAAMASTLPPIGSLVLFTYIDTVGTWLRQHESGVGIYIAGFAVLAGLALLPTYASAILGGWAFGLKLGFPAAMAGFLGASLIAYAIGRPTAATRVEAVLQSRPKWRAVRDALVGGSSLRCLGIVTLLRLPPNSPFALTNLVLSSSRVPLWIYALGTVVGMAPRTGLVLFVASRVRDHVASEAAKTSPWWIVAIGIAATLAVLVVIGIISKRALDRVTKGGVPKGEVPEKVA
jgi:uncharacterized membrane protein YdjX (TVP38/TMEM64 family)